MSQEGSAPLSHLGSPRKLIYEFLNSFLKFLVNMMHVRASQRGNVRHFDLLRGQKERDEEKPPSDGTGLLSGGPRSS